MFARLPDNVPLRVLVGAVLAGILPVLDATIVVPLLPTIGKDLGGETAVVWLVAGYLLTSTVTIPLWGRWMDLRGERTPMWAALAVFVAGTIISATAPGLTVLIAGRLLQGIGAGGITPLGQAIIAARCSSEERARLQIYYNVAYGGAAGFGPLLGGALVHVSWRAAFWIVIPFAGAVAVALWGQLRRTPIAKELPPFDWVGSALTIVGLTLLLVGVERLSWVYGSAGLVIVAIYIWRALHVEHGLIPHSVLKSRTIIACGLVGLIIGFTQFAFLTFLPTLSLELEPTRNSGLVVIPLTVLWMTLGSVTGQLALRYGTRRFVALAIAFAMAAGPVVALWYSYTGLLVAATFVGASAGFALIPVLLLAQRSAPVADMGAATSTLVLLRNFGGALGASFMAVLLASQGLTTTMWLASAVAALAIIPLLLMPGGPPGRSPTEVPDAARA